MLAARRALANPTTTSGPPLPPLAGLVTHLDATQITGTSDGTAIASWTNLANVGSPTTATTGHQPTYYSTTSGKLINGKPAVYFNGSTSYMTIAAGAGNSFHLIALVYQPQTGGGVLVSSTTTSTSTSWYFSQSDTSFAARDGNPQQTSSVTTTNQTSSAHTAIIRFDDFTFGPAVWYDGTKSSLALADGCNSSGDGAAILGAFSGGTSSWYPGLIGELLIWSSTQTDSDLVTGTDSVYKYLKAKWGTP